MGRPYSVDLRVRVVCSVDEGKSVDEAAERFGVTARTIWSWLTLKTTTEDELGICSNSSKDDRLLGKALQRSICNITKLALLSHVSDVARL